MALSFRPSCKGAFTALIALGLVAIPSLSGTFSGEAQAQTFIERILKQDAQKAKQHRKRPAARHTQRKSAPKQTARQAAPAPKAEAQPAPGIAIPVPASRPEEPGKIKPEPKTAPVPEEKPDTEPQEQPHTAPPPPANLPAKPSEPTDNPEQTDKQRQESKPESEGRIYQVACPALISGEVEGKLLPPIKDGAQCGVHSPLSLTAIGKEEPLKFANAVTTNCAMAVTLSQWSSEVAKAAKDVYGPGSKITEIGVGSDYQCRKVNGASSGRVSEHAFGNALDIMSFTFSDGSKTQLESGWNGSDKEKAFWRAVHSASCKLFMTVIGPDGDAAHRTNMHLDQGCHGKSCLARICQ